VVVERPVVAVPGGRRAGHDRRRDHPSPTRAARTASSPSPRTAAAS
jgi:hypothetical protein